jgi:hypothetical protein
VLGLFNRRYEMKQGDAIYASDDQENWVVTHFVKWSKEGGAFTHTMRSSAMHGLIDGEYVYVTTQSSYLRMLGISMYDEHLSDVVRAAVFNRNAYIAALSDAISTKNSWGKNEIKQLIWSIANEY